MQIDKIDNTNFQAVKAKSVQELLFSRLNRPNRNIHFNSFANVQDKKEYDIVLKEGKGHCLSATVCNKDGKVILSEKENIFCGVLNLNPMRFLEKVSEKADSLFHK